MNSFKGRVQAGETLFGCFLGLGSSLTAEIVGGAGFDWVLIDLEHGSGDEGDVLHQLQALDRTAAVPIVRVESHERQRFHRVLDLGACGIMVPRVNNADEAKVAISALRYPPAGVRGVAQMNRACDFGRNFKGYLETANERLLGVLQIESIEGVRNVDSIAELDGADVLFVGPSDLSQAMGIVGQFDHPEFQRALREVGEAAQRHGKTAGVLMKSPLDFTAYWDMGYRFLACGSDGGMLSQAAHSLSESLGAERQRMAETEVKGA
jgi:4-hydroxy-2-oxoheptanedioate aldolase